MKKILITGLIVFTSAFAHSANVQVMTAVLGAPELSELSDIDKVEVVDTFRCPNCYNIKISGRNFYGDAWLVVQTEQRFGQGLGVKVISRSK